MPFTQPVPVNSMKLNGVAGDVEPGGIPSTLPQRTTWIAVPMKWSFCSASSVFHWPPCPAVGLQPGFTLPPQLNIFEVLIVFDWPRKVPVIWLNLAPPPVSQHPSFEHAGLEITQSCAI